MWGWDGFGYTWMGWAFGLVMMLLMLAGLVVLAVWAVARLTDRSPASETPEAILCCSLAAGEITKQEFEHLRQVLHGRP